MEEVVLDTQVPYTLKALVFGLQATTIAAITLAFFALLLIISWKNSIVQIFIQTISKVLPAYLFIGNATLQKVSVAPKIDAEHCAICYCDIEKEVKSNCGHVFCGDCIIKFWHSKKKEKMCCPLCRGDMNLLIPNFNTQNVCPKDQQTQEIVQNITHYNISCSSCPSTILQLVLGSPQSMKIFLESLPSRQGFSKYLKGFLGFLYGLAMLMYMISPNEAKPASDEMDTMFGWIDDSSSVIYLSLYVIILFVMVA